jgi:regulatory protein
MRKRSTTDRASQDEASLNDQSLHRVFQQAVKLLTAKSWSIAELNDRLLKNRRNSRAIVDVVISRLREYGYLDDERYAFGYASLKVKQRPVGRRRLKHDLLMKKVEEDTVEEALTIVYGETSEEELIERAIEKRIRLRGVPQTHDAARKLFAHLLRQGFPYELASEKVQKLVNLDE